MSEYGKMHSKRFNPRARVGRDSLLQKSWERSMLVSIHAPAWGATAYLGYDSI